MSNAEPTATASTDDPPVSTDDIAVRGKGAGATLGYKPQGRNGKPLKQAATCSATAIMWIVVALCLAMGIAVFVVPATWTDLAIPEAGAPINRTCPAVTPESSPHAAVAAPASQRPFIAAWEAYVARVEAREEGVRPGCSPMRFPATAAFRGVAVVWHGFSSCPQEMSTFGPALAAAGYDVVFPLMAGHGNAIRYSPDAPNFLWAFLGIAVALGALSCIACARVMPRACACSGCCAEGGGCGHTKRTGCIVVSALLCGCVLLTAVVGYAVMMAGDDDFCISLSFVDGVGPGCGGMSEYNDNLPTTASG